MKQIETAFFIDKKYIPMTPPPTPTGLPLSSTSSSPTGPIVFAFVFFLGTITIANSLCSKRNNYVLFDVLAYGFPIKLDSHCFCCFLGNHLPLTRRGTRGVCCFGECRRGCTYGRHVSEGRFSGTRSPQGPWNKCPISGSVWYSCRVATSSSLMYVVKTTFITASARVDNGVGKRMALPALSRTALVRDN